MLRETETLPKAVADDLRTVFMALKINNDLERIADHALNVAERAEALGGRGLHGRGHLRQTQRGDLGGQTRDERRSAGA